MAISESVNLKVPLLALPSLGEQAQETKQIIILILIHSLSTSPHQ